MSVHRPNCPVLIWSMNDRGDHCYLGLVLFTVVYIYFISGTIDLEC